jgi:hypothetical protein
MRRGDAPTPTHPVRAGRAARILGPMATRPTALAQTLSVVTAAATAASCALLLHAGAVSAEPPAHAREAELLTLGVEKPASLGRLRAEGAAEVAALIAVYEDGSLPRHARLRALGVLADSPRPEARSYLEGLVRAAGEAAGASDELHPARAAGVVLRALRGFRRTPSALPTAALAGCLRHGQAAVRAEAVLLLKAQHTPEARRLLDAHGAVEQSPRVQAALRAAP